MIRKFGWRNGPPIGLAHFLGDLVCTIVGHHAPYRATEAWDSTRRVWFRVNDETNATVCRRCCRTLSGWTLWFR